MTSLIIIFSLIFVTCLIVALAASSKEDNSQYYQDGYHIYYDRRIIREMSKKTDHISLKRGEKL